MAKPSGNTASRATPPRMSQVSLPSQIGAMEFITIGLCSSDAKP